MRKRISPTIMERAAAAVPAFNHVLRKLDKQVTLRGQSQSTLNNYSRRIADKCIDRKPSAYYTLIF